MITFNVDQQSKDMRFLKLLLLSSCIFFFIFNISSCKKESKQNEQNINIDSLNVQYNSFLDAFRELKKYREQSVSDSVNIYVLSDSITNDTPSGMFIFKMEGGDTNLHNSDTALISNFKNPFISFSSDSTNNLDPMELLNSNIKLAQGLRRTEVGSLKHTIDFKNRSLLIIPGSSNEFMLDNHKQTKFAYPVNSTNAQFGISEISDSNVVISNINPNALRHSHINFNSLDSELWTQIKSTYPTIVGKMSYEELIVKMDFLKNSRIEYEWESDSTVGDISLKIENRDVDIREKEIEGINIPLHGKLKCKLEIDGGFGTYSFKVTKVFFNDGTEGKIKLNPKKIKSTVEDDPYETFLIIISEK